MHAMARILAVALACVVAGSVPGARGDLMVDEGYRLFLPGEFVRRPSATDTPPPVTLRFRDSSLGARTLFQFEPAADAESAAGLNLLAEAPPEALRGLEVALRRAERGAEAAPRAEGRLRLLPERTRPMQEARAWIALSHAGAAAR